MIDQTRVSRRRFLEASAAVTAGGLAAPYIIPADVLAGPGRAGANDRIGIGWIGTGRRAHQMISDLKTTRSLPGECRVVAVSDLWTKKSHEYLKTYEERVLGPKGGKTGAEYGIYQDYRKLLESKDVDAVVLTTPEHWRALPCIHACQAGKDVYAEKPLSLTIREGRAMVEAVRKHKRVSQVGTQQRSYQRNREASEYVRNGRIGRVHTVLCQNWLSSRPDSDYKLPTETVPAGLDWDMWCGQTEPLPYSEQVYRTYINPGWHNLSRYSGGWLNNAGSHALDMVQWALGMDDTGPVEVWAKRKSYDSPAAFRYANGVVVKLEHSCAGPGIPPWKSMEEPVDAASQFGAIFVGDKGTLIEHRGRFNTKPIAISQEPIKKTDTHLYNSGHHFQNWINCIKSRERCAADIEIGHRTCTLCHLVNIARQLGRKLRWNPEREIFPDDAEANALLDRPQRAPYQLPETAEWRCPTHEGSTIAFGQ